ncbi:type II secretion system F family protein [Methylobacterium nonmethylotrophicum]|uniref:Type II secretion system F family protein n=1 Tax=Methylobacterium nonmethylotrophicum TaxID=1141884 RepID=A0A4Z0NQ92_9HYPH|nr:type II secretion system F family protein [Methylobacterium nonmethylotrophicum]TGD98592.1 type II secretion system F family protein [Methylobacterium nonmethylotrophicum]
MIDVEAALAAGLLAVSAVSFASAVVVPLLPSEARAAKRQQALIGQRQAAERVQAVSRRDQVAKSLKEIEDKEKKSKISLELRLTQAGLSIGKRQFYVFSAVAGLIFGLAGLLTSGDGLLALGLAFAGGLGLPRWLLSYLRKRRMARFIVELPNAMDVIVRGIRSGLPVGDCLRIIAREAQEPVKTEFRALVEAQALGISLGDAVARLYERMPVSEANFFAIVVGIQQKSGGNLSEALGNLSRVLRERRKMAEKVKAMSMEAKASAAIIASLPFVVAGLAYLTSPDYISLLWTTTIGHIALFGSALWMIIGVVVMSKMIRFDI